MIADAPPAAARPLPPRDLGETGLSRELVSDLLLKLLYVQGARTGYQLLEAIRLPFEIVDLLILELQQRRFVEVRSTNGPSRTGYTFDLTSAGRDRAREALATNQYAGPAPVPLAHYREWVERQSIKGIRVSRDRVHASLRELVLAERLFDTIGPAINSAGSLFLYGPPGNGKTRIAELVARLLGEEAVYIPYAVEIDGQIMVIYDPVHHRPEAAAMSPSAVPLGTAAPGIAQLGVGPLPTPQLGTGALGTAPPGAGALGATPLAAEASLDTLLLLHHSDHADQRYARVARPVVAAGGELTLEQLDLQYDPQTKLYRAPFQVKANGGVLIIDDFGRQRIPPRDLLNRWIVPLERRIDYLTLHTGMKFPIPFDCMVIFATNLDPADLVDEAFLRRIHYKVEVADPGREEFEAIFERECREREIPFDPEAVDYIDRLYYKAQGISPRGCHPRDILRHLESIARYQDLEPTLSEELLGQACSTYFLAMAGGDIPITTRKEV